MKNVSFDHAESDNIRTAQQREFARSGAYNIISEREDTSRRMRHPREASTAEIRDQQLRLLRQRLVSNFYGCAKRFAKNTSEANSARLAQATDQLRMIDSHIAKLETAKLDSAMSESLAQLREAGIME